MSNSYGIIILAAGSSSRLGQPKQLLLYRNKTLLQYLIDETKNTIADSIVVVLGSNAEVIQVSLQAEKIHIVINANCNEGMSSSIRCGINELKKINPAVDAAIIMVCDQPFVNSELLNKLFAAHTQTNKQIITCSYSDTTGTPVLFEKALFPELLQLKGETGAKNIVRKYTAEVAIVSFPAGDIDIDTIADYDRLINS